MAKGTVTIKSLRSGQTVYRVCGVGKNAVVSKCFITSRPYKEKNKNSVLYGVMWVKTKRYLPSLNCWIDDFFSLSDSGIYKPHTNSKNKTFYGYKAALRHYQYVKKLEVYYG